jgi:HEAT repeat protein
MIDQVLNALVASNNEAADDVLLEALRLGAEPEQAMALDALIRRGTVRGLGGVVAQFESLPQGLRATCLRDIKRFHHALRECGRSDQPDVRLAAISLIALGRQGKLAYVLSENLHESNESLSKAAAAAMSELARWVSETTRSLQKGLEDPGIGASGSEAESADPEAPRPPSADIYAVLIDQRTEIEAAVARAMDAHRGKHGPELLRAALMLCDWPGSKTLAILQTSKHGGQSPLVRRLQQAPAAEHIEAFLLGATHGGLRSHFGNVFSHIVEAPVLDSLLRKTHWLKDHQLQACMNHVVRGSWLTDIELTRDIQRREPADAARIAEWIGCSGVHDVVQDERMKTLLASRLSGDFDARLRLLRIAARRKRGGSTELLKAMLLDTDERIVRMAAREIVRRRPLDFENVLLQRMTTAPDSVRRVIGRAIGQVGFDHFWQRFDRLDPATRKGAGRAMLKLLPDAALRLERRLGSGLVEQRIKALQIVQDLELVELLRESILPLCGNPNVKIRSKAVAVLGELSAAPPPAVMDRMLADADPRVRSNAIEVLEAREQTQYIPLLAERARSNHHRERANAIKALHRLKVANAGNALVAMLRDPRPEHRIAAMWALREMQCWHLLSEVGRLAKEDGNMRVRRYALNVLRSVAERVQQEKGKTA